MIPHESVNGYLDRINFYNNSQVARHKKEFTISMEKDLNSIYIYEIPDSSRFKLPLL